jgi:hypothetical protein
MATAMASRWRSSLRTLVTLVTPVTLAQPAARRQLSDCLPSLFCLLQSEGREPRPNYRSPAPIGNPGSWGKQWRHFAPARAPQLPKNHNLVLPAPARTLIPKTTRHENTYRTVIA